MASRALAHHALCFGCGQANPFGLQLELEPRPEGGVAGRFFVKQDHQGAPGYAHAGVLAAALQEAIGLLLDARPTGRLPDRLELDLHAPAPVGSFVELEAERRPAGGGGAVTVVAEARGENGRIATALGTFA